MADNFGLKIGLEGEKEFKNALANINQQFKVLGSEMTLVESQFGKNDKSVEALTARNKVLGAEIEAQKSKIETLRSALENASTSFGETDKRTLNWQTQLNNATAALNNMERELEDNRKEIEKAGDEMDDCGDKADDLEEEIKETGDEAEDSGGKFSKLGSIVKGVGAAMGVAVAAIGTAAVAAGKALVDMTVASAAYADEMLTQSTVTGLSTDTLQAYSYAADLVDVSLETLTGSMAKNVKSMKSATDGSKLYVEAYEKLGVSVTDANGEMRDSETVYWECIDALGAMTNETERDALAMQLFGRSAQELNPLIAQGSEGIAKLTEEAHNVGAVLGEETISKLGAFDDSVQRLSQGAAATKRVIGTVLLPQLQSLADDGTSLLNDFTSGLVNAGGDFDKISEVIGTSIGNLVTKLMGYLPNFIALGLDIVMSIGGAIMDNLPLLIEGAVQLVTTILQGVISALPALAEGAVQLVLTLVDGILTNLPMLIETALQVIVTLALGIAEALPTLIPTIIEVIITIITTLIENLPMILDAALQLVTGLAQGIIDAIPVLIEALPQIILSIVEFIIGAIPQIIEAGIQLLTSLVEALPTIIENIITVLPQIIDGIITAVLEGIPLIIQAGIDLLITLVQALPTIITTIVKAIPEIIMGLVNAIINNIPAIIQAGIELLVSLIANLPTIIIEIVKAVPEIIKGLVSAFGDAIPQIVEAGGNLVKGIWDGISNAASWLWDKVTGWVDGLVGGIKDFLGIHSPSTVFAGIGENMGEGIGVGFEDAMDGVEKEMESAIPTEFDIDSTLKGAVSTGGNFAHGLNVTIPLTLDGHTLARIISEIQWTQNAAFVRNLGMA